MSDIITAYPTSGLADRTFNDLIKIFGVLTGFYADFYGLLL